MIKRMTKMEEVTPATREDIAQFLELINSQIPQLHRLAELTESCGIGLASIGSPLRRLAATLSRAREDQITDLAESLARELADLRDDLRERLSE